ncbi:hypothetical protein ACGF12_22665 [Kitasatospora sp. NPDC048296]|uniref:hypothetical protein n=1 Tax=Kitasatospora sp. NPDC048296 TaxID=3364048 RepID=UPI003721D462
MSSAARPRIGRSYTKARRHPWVLGKIGDWRIPLGPYTPPQLVVAAVGAVALIKTATWWAPYLGPLPVAAWAVAVWAARHSRIAGRSPFLVAADALSLVVSPRNGQIGGRAVRPARPVLLARGGFTFEDGVADDDFAAADDLADVPEADERPVPLLSLFEPREPVPAPPSQPAVPRPAAPQPAAARAAGPALTPLQQMLAAAAVITAQKGDPT